MEICLDVVDSQTAKLDEFVLVAHRTRKTRRGVRPGLSNFKLSPRKGGHTRVSSLTSGKNPLTANGSFILASPELGEALASTIFPHPEETIRGEGRIANLSHAISVALQDHTRSQQASEETQASPLGSDGGPQGELLQRSFSPPASLDIVTILPPESKIESSGGLCTPQTNSIAPQDRQRLQQTSKEAQASVLRSDGGPQGVLLQRSPSASAPLEVMSGILESSIEGAEGLRTHQVPPKGVSPLPRKSDTSSAFAGLRRSSKTSETAAATRQPEREDLSATRAKVPRKRGSQCKDLISSVKTPSLHTLITQPGSGSGAAPPDGEASQGPSLVDYNLEIEADFPKELVLTMQENATKKARRTVIGRTLGGRATFKMLLNCLKLHLPAPLVSTTLLTRGYFEILFEDEEGAKTTRRLTAVEWSNLHLSFSRYISNFNTSSQGAEVQLTHAIKVQFPNLHEQFRNTKALTIMASKIGEVLEIEPAESYIKRLAGPLITIKLKDISKLSGYIRIPSMAEGAETDDMIAQRILYFGLPN